MICRLLDEDIWHVVDDYFRHVPIVEQKNFVFVVMCGMVVLLPDMYRFVVLLLISKNNSIVLSFMVCWFIWISKD